MSIATRTGDDGMTGLFGGGRVPKDDPRVSAYGDVDELNSVLGSVRAAGLAADIDRIILAIQDHLFDLGAELATRREGNPHAHLVPPFTDAAVKVLDDALAVFEPRLPPMTTFILPGGSTVGAALHVARCVARRAERRVVTLSRLEPVPPAALHYLNRVSGLLFVLACCENLTLGVPETEWHPKR